MFPGAFSVDDLTRASRGRFREATPLSAGATATVFHAHDTVLDSPIALKVSHGSLEANHCLREEFRLLTGPLLEIGEKGREQTACRCFGLLEFEGRVAIVLEYLDPDRYAPLERIAEQASDLTEHQVLEILVPFFGLLAAAHDAGLIYNDAGRDKASHLLWSQSDRQLKVIDWANVIDTTRASSTQSRRPYHDVIGCGELLLLLRRGPDAPCPPPEEEVQALGFLGQMIRRCLNFTDPNAFDTARPLEQAARYRMREIQSEFDAGVQGVRVLFGAGSPHKDFEAARAGLQELRALIPDAPPVEEIDRLLRGWAASLTARDVLQQADADLRARQATSAYQKFRLVLNLLQAHRGMLLDRDERAVRLGLALSRAAAELPELLPEGAMSILLNASPQDLPRSAGTLLRQLLDDEDVARRRQIDPAYALDLLSALADCAGIILWSAEVERLSRELQEPDGAEGATALQELRQSLQRLEGERPNEEVWRDLVRCYEGVLDQVRAIESSSPGQANTFEQAAAKALAVARQSRDLWANGDFSRAVEALTELREADWESRVARNWVASARDLEERWWRPPNRRGLPSALAWLPQQESPAALVFQLRDTLEELDTWARGARGSRERDDEAYGGATYLESLRVILAAFLRCFEYLGVPRQRHPAQKLVLRALATSIEELESVKSVRMLGAQLLQSNWDDAAWDLANEAASLSRCIEERRREQPIFKKIVGFGQRDRPEQNDGRSQIVDITQRLRAASASAPLLGILVRLPEVCYQEALTYGELGEWEAAKMVLGELRIVGTSSDETFVKITLLHRAVALAAASALESNQGDATSAAENLDLAFQELQANSRFRHEFRGVAEALRERRG